MPVQSVSATSLRSSAAWLGGGFPLLRRSDGRGQLSAAKVVCMVNTVMLLRTRQLHEAGWSDRDIRASVRSGRLIRLREGAFCLPDTDPACIEAGRAYGRLACVSELQRLGVFVLEHDEFHVHIARTSSRLPARGSRQRRHHRRRLLRQPSPDALTVEPLDAIFDAVLCLPPRAAIAAIDSALHLGVLRSDELDELFDALPRRYRRLRRLLDPRAESGSETLMRLILRSLGCVIEAQVAIAGVGRVDFLVDGWLIIECDSKAHHSDWAAQRRDRRRDLAAAALGYTTFRPIAEDIMWAPDRVRAAVVGLLTAAPRRRYRLS
jgi:very-short-patch-repair endonuclease